MCLQWACAYLCIVGMWGSTRYLGWVCGLEFGHVGMCAGVWVCGGACGRVCGRAGVYAGVRAWVGVCRWVDMYI